MPKLENTSTFMKLQKPRVVIFSPDVFIFTMIVIAMTTFTFLFPLELAVFKRLYLRETIAVFSCSFLVVNIIVMIIKNIDSRKTYNEIRKAMVPGELYFYLGGSQKSDVWLFLGFANFCHQSRKSSDFMADICADFVFFVPSSTNREQIIHMQRFLKDHSSYFQRVPCD